MRGWLIVLAIVVLSVMVQAAGNESLCSDTDGGGSSYKDNAIKVKGEVKYGITTQVDTCLSSEEGVSINASKWLKEYFCRDDKRDSEVYDCIKYGFDGCVNGECKGGTTTGNQTVQQQPEDACGNEIVEKAKGEECDPPNKICFGKTTSEYGICGADCKCVIAGAAKQAMESQPAVCGDAYKHATEECEEDSDCQSGFVCSSCKCVKQLTAEEIEALKRNATAVAEEEKKDISEEIEDKYKYEAPDLPEIEAKNFSEEPALKATSGIAGFFKKIFGWIASLFS